MCCIFFCAFSFSCSIAFFSDRFPCHRICSVNFLLLFLLILLSHFLLLASLMSPSVLHSLFHPPAFSYMLLRLPLLDRPFLSSSPASSSIASSSSTSIGPGPCHCRRVPESGGRSFHLISM